MPLSMKQMKSQWKSISGNEMPEDVQFLSTEKILLALKTLRDGGEAVVPVRRDKVAPSNYGDSMMDWDSHGFL